MTANVVVDIRMAQQQHAQEFLGRHLSLHQHRIRRLRLLRLGELHEELTMRPDATGAQVVRLRVQVGLQQLDVVEEHERTAVAFGERGDEVGHVLRAGFLVGHLRGRQGRERFDHGSDERRGAVRIQKVRHHLSQVGRPRLVRALHNQRDDAARGGLSLLVTQRRQCDEPRERVTQRGRRGLERRRLLQDRVCGVREAQDEGILGDATRP